MKNPPMQWNPFSTMPVGVYCVLLVPNDHGVALPYIAVREVVCGHNTVRYWTEGAPRGREPTHWLKLPKAPTPSGPDLYPRERRMA